MQLESRLIEIRDEGTCIPAIAIRMVNTVHIHNINAFEACEWLIHTRSGYPENGSGIVLMRLSDQKATVDPYEWGGRTMPAAHHYVCEHFDELEDGQVLDVRVVLREAEKAVESDRFWQAPK